jgi:hypothetical protein
VRSTNVSAGESVASNPQSASRIMEAEVTAFAPREGRNMTRQTNKACLRAHLAAVGSYEMESTLATLHLSASSSMSR